MEELLKKLSNPSKEYRPVPFWSWNDKLEPGMLQWQIREMDKAGLGGYFMHARGGLQTEYLGEDWMDCIKACLEEGDRLGMSSWCYDEDGWPSGFAGGKVTAMGDKYHVRWLEREELVWDGKGPADTGILGYYRLEEGKFSRMDGEDLTPGEKVTVVRHKSSPYYIDILNEKVIKAFIEVTHEEYHRLFGEAFGKGMPGFFTDEPQFSRGQIPWSYVIPEKFKDKYGYDLLEQLPLIFLDNAGYEKVRYDFWALVSELYVGSFGKQIYDWCEEHNCKLTGHVMSEDSIFSQMMCTAGAMPFYEYMHIPGMDWLCRKIESPVIPKQVGSVASQLGKKFVLSETFALCGWDVSWEELKWIAEWQYVNGVNFMCQHLEAYTLRGLRKRDYPPSMFYQQSWWEEYGRFNDYFSRLGVLLTSGKHAVEVLLLHPIKSGWIAYDGCDNAAVKKLDEDFIHATEWLSGLHIEHHYGDETIVKRYGKVEKDRLIVGQCQYKVVVMPSMLSMDESTADLLGRFLDNGGMVISIGDFPYLCEGKPDEVLNSIKKRVKCIGYDSEELKAAVLSRGVSVVNILEENTEVDSIHIMQREMEDKQVFFLVNLSQTQTFHTEVTIKGCGDLKKYSPFRNELEAIPFTASNGMIRMKLEFLPMQSHVLILEKDSMAQPDLVLTDHREIRPGSDWTVEEMDLNSLTLDYCSYSIDGGEWVGPVAVTNLMGILLKHKKSCGISLKFNFEFKAAPENVKELYLVVEAAQEFEMALNGRQVKYADIGWWKDSSFKKVDIKPYLQEGDNEVILSRSFYQQQKVYDVLFGEDVLETERNKLTFDTELESIYIVGDFGVMSKSGYTYGERKAVFTEGPFAIVEKPMEVSPAELTEQGFCFFAGAVKLSRRMELEKDGNSRLLLDIGNPCAVLAKVFVNDRAVEVLPWAPYKADITDFITSGANKITLQLFSGNRNLLGPHHHIDGELYAVGPASFSEMEGWEGASGRRIWTDRYCFVKFGLE